MPDITQQHTKILSAVTVTGAGSAYTLPSGNRGQSYQAVVAGTGAVTATVVVEVSNDGTNWDTLGTITLSGTTIDSDSFGNVVQWCFVRGNVTAISGTGAAVTLSVGM